MPMEKLNVISHQNTKIIATVGPASSSTEVLTQLVQEGVDVFRLNFSHGSHEVHKETIDKILAIRERYNVTVGILADLQGPKLRVGVVEEGTILSEGDEIIFTNEECVGNKERVYMSYPQFANDVTVGEKVLVNDGKLVFEVAATDNKSEVRLKTLFGGELSSKKGVNLPDTNISQPSLTEKDLEDLDFILKQPVNWIALSFVRKAEDIDQLKYKISKANHPAKVIAKIEKPEAIQNLKDIVRATDAVMVARGDLGVEVPMERLPAIQKDIVRLSMQHAKPVIVATQMMESMITNPSPTRAEITDVANAVLDGTDAVMLSGETSVGAHPPLVVKAMNKIIEEAEKHYERLGRSITPDPQSKTFYSDTICINAAKIAEDIDAKAILGLTVSGYTAFKVSSCRPKSKIYVFSDRVHMLDTLNLVWGVECLHFPNFETASTDETIYQLCDILKEKNLLKEGDIVVNTGSMPVSKGYRTNMLKITKVD